MFLASALRPHIRQSHHLIHLTQEARKDLAVWKLFLDNFNGVSLCLPNTWTSSNCIWLYSDASGSGFAAVLGSRWFQGSFPSSWAHVSIVVKELLPIVLVVRLWAPFLANSRILFMCDNMSVVSVINSQTSRDVSVVQLLRELVVACMRHNIQFSAWQD